MTGRPRALAPDLELLDRRGAEGVAGRQHQGVPFRLELLRELADGGGLAGAVDADHQDHERLLRGIDAKGDRHGRERALDLRRQDLADRVRRDALLVAALAHGLRDPGRGLDAEIGLDQRVLELLQRVGVELALGEQAGDALGQRRGGALHAPREAAPPAALRLFARRVGLWHEDLRRDFRLGLGTWCESGLPVRARARRLGSLCRRPRRRVPGSSPAVPAGGRSSRALHGLEVGALEFVRDRILVRCALRPARRAVAARGRRPSRPWRNRAGPRRARRGSPRAARPVRPPARRWSCADRFGIRRLNRHRRGPLLLLGAEHLAQQPARPLVFAHSRLLPGPGMVSAGPCPQPMPS